MRLNLAAKRMKASLEQQAGYSLWYFHAPAWLCRKLLEYVYYYFYWKDHRLVLGYEPAPLRSKSASLLKVTPKTNSVLDEQSSSPFFSLPQEIRDQICTQLLMHEVRIRISQSERYGWLEVYTYGHDGGARDHTRRKRDVLRHGRPQNLLARYLAMIIVCKRMHADVANVVYGRNLFHFKQANAVTTLFRQVGPDNLSRLRSIHLEVTYWGISRKIGVLPVRGNLFNEQDWARCCSAIASLENRLQVRVTFHFVEPAAFWALSGDGSLDAHSARAILDPLRSICATHTTDIEYGVLIEREDCFEYFGENNLFAAADCDHLSLRRIQNRSDSRSWHRSGCGSAWQSKSRIAIN